MSAFVINPYRFTPAFVPTDISGLVGWWDASDASTLYDATTGGSLVAADGTIARWEDKSTNAWHLTQSITSPDRRPIRKVSIQNSKDVVRFTGATASKWMDSTSVSVNQPSTIFVAGSTTRFNAASGSREYFLDGITSRNIVAARGNQTNEPSIWAGTAFISSGVATPSGFFMAGGTFNGSSSKAFTNATTGTAANAGSVNQSGLRVGISPAPGDPLDGDIGEILIYNSALSAGDITKVYDYFVAKWSI